MGRHVGSRPLASATGATKGADVHVNVAHGGSRHIVRPPGAPVSKHGGRKEAARRMLRFSVARHPTPQGSRQSRGRGPAAAEQHRREESRPWSRPGRCPPETATGSSSRMAAEIRHEPHRIDHLPAQKESTARARRQVICNTAKARPGRGLPAAFPSLLSRRSRLNPRTTLSNSLAQTAMLVCANNKHAAAWRLVRTFFVGLGSCGHGERR